MRTEIHFYQLTLPRKRFEISTGARTTAEVFVVFADHGNLQGVGSGSPASSMNDNPLKCRDTLSVPQGFSSDPEDFFDERVSFNMREKSPAAAAAMDIAIWDLLGKQNGVSISNHLGVSSDAVPTDATIDLKSPGAAKQEADNLVNSGFKTLKIKIGGSLRTDVDRVKAVREAAGENISIVVDANGGYDFKQASDFLSKTTEYKIEFFEQPLPGEMLKELADLRTEHGVKICLDESVSNEIDIMEAIEKEAADIVNIKLMKCGGLTAALEMVDVARKNRLEIMTGCMGDIGISISAAAHLAAGKSAEYVDLDSHLNIESVCDGPAVREGNILMNNLPGHGIRLNEDWQKWVIDRR
ncbi:MAG: dipeptide epimerase [Thermoplasmata archaeon]|nr:dipeptide epimerase [Thermoplasmata archaeon]